MDNIVSLIDVNDLLCLAMSFFGMNRCKRHELDDCACEVATDLVDPVQYGSIRHK